RREAEVGSTPRRERRTVLEDPPGVAEADGRVYQAGVAGRAAQADGRPLRAVGVRQAGDRRRGGHVVHQDARAGWLADAAVLGGGRQRPYVAAVVARREAEAGATARGIGGAVLGDAPGVGEAVEPVYQAGVAGRAAQADGRPLRAVAAGRHAGD